MIYITVPTEKRTLIITCLRSMSIPRGPLELSGTNVGANSIADGISTDLACVYCYEYRMSVLSN